MSLIEEYYVRVRPVVGQALSTRRIAVWGLDLGYLAAEALARTGLRRQTWFDDGVADGALCRSFGRELCGRPRGEALAEQCRRHNTLEESWELSTRRRDLGELRAHLAAEPPHLLLAAGDADAEEVARAAIDAGVPLVMVFVPAGPAVGVCQVVWIPGGAVAPADLLRTCGELAAVPALDLDRPENHLDGLEARSLSLALAKWILLRGDGATRPDLEEPIVQRGRSVVLRGQPDWPWAVRFARPTPAIAALAGAAGQRYRSPLALLRRERVLVLGLGTGSLFCAEAPLLFSHLLFVDCKEVAPVNPVRQIYSTSHLGQPKERAMVEILAARTEPAAAWTAHDDGTLYELRSSQRTLAGARLRLSADADALSRYRDLLDRFRPTLAIVGMGRSRDVNFVAAEELRQRGIRHITPSAFPGVTHFKQILTDGASGPCYDCLQGHLAVDGGAGPTLAPEEREMFYGGSQPATLAETYPSAHSLLRLAADLALPRAARPLYLLGELAAERCCFVGANRAERSGGDWLYGVDRPFNIVTYGVSDVIAETARGRCSCGRELRR
jgi:hypothetical protein